jgi:pyridoxamine 5'-phosphate oxidase family protein
MSFSPDEIAYLTSQPLARLATVAPDGRPDVVPVAFELDGSAFWVGGPGASVLATRKFRNVVDGHREVALVVDDMVSFDPFVARGIRVYGQASDPVERVGLVGPGTYVRITPTTSWSWNMEGAPVGDTWYPAHRREHAG